MNDAIGRKFVPARMLGGLALALGGVAGVFAMFFTDLTDGVISVKLLLLCGILVLGGGALAFASFARACMRCQTELQSTALFGPPDWFAHFANVVQSGHSSQIGTLAQVPYVPPGAGSLAMIEMSYCPSCRQVARMHAALRTYSPSDPNQWKDTQATAAATIVGSEVAQLVQFAHVRLPGSSS